MRRHAEESPPPSFPPAAIQTTTRFVRLSLLSERQGMEVMGRPNRNETKRSQYGQQHLNIARLIDHSEEERRCWYCCGTSTCLPSSAAPSFLPPPSPSCPPYEKKRLCETSAHMRRQRRLTTQKKRRDAWWLYTEATSARKPCTLDEADRKLMIV